MATVPEVDWDELLAPLSEKERNLIKLRLGTDRGTVPRTLEEVASILNLDTVLVADIQAEAMQKLRDLEP